MICKYCDRIIPDDSKICPKCKGELTPADDGKAKNDKEKKR